MTTEREMELAYATQEEVIAALYKIGDADLVHRLQRCMTARQRSTMAAVGHTPADRRPAFGAVAQ